MKQVTEDAPKEEKLTKELVDAHLMSFVEISPSVGQKGGISFAWKLSNMVDGPINRQLAQTEGKFAFKTAGMALSYALEWIRKNMPDLEQAAVKEAKEGIRYRAWKSTQ